jgi:hypothetical protein
MKRRSLIKMSALGMLAVFATFATQVSMATNCRSEIVSKNDEKVQTIFTDKISSRSTLAWHWHHRNHRHHRNWYDDPFWNDHYYYDRPGFEFTIPLFRF